MKFHASLYLLASGPEGVREAIKGGVDIVQFRNKDSPDNVLIERLQAVKEITDAAGVPLIINDRPDLCLRFGADGVHLGQEDMSVEEAREMLGPERVIGISTHSLEMALRADEAGVVDYIAIGPVFRTPSKDTPVQPLGLDPLWDVVVCVSTPVVAIGGITGDNIKEVLSTGIQRVAVIGGIAHVMLPSHTLASIAKAQHDINQPHDQCIHRDGIFFQKAGSVKFLA